MAVNLRLLSRGLVLAVVFAGLVFAGLFARGAEAYIGQNPYAVHLDGPAGVVSCQSQVVITATVRDAETGVLVSHQAVEWDIKVSLSPGDRLSDRSTVTGADGKTSVTLSFGPAEGTRTVRATISTFPATIDVTCRGGVPAPTPSRRRQRPSPRQRHRPCLPPTRQRAHPRRPRPQARPRPRHRPCLRPARRRTHPRRPRPPCPRVRSRPQPAVLLRSRNRPGPPPRRPYQRRPPLPTRPQPLVRAPIWPWFSSPVSS